MKKLSLVLILTMFVTILAGCSITINGKKVLSMNEDKKIAWPVGNNVAEKTEVLEQDIDGQDRINVSNAVGEIEFKPWDNDKVQITALKRVRAGGDKEKLEKLLDDIKVNISRGSNNIDVTVDYIDGMWGFNQQNVRLEIMVPNKLKNIKAHSASGKIRISEFNDLDEVELTSVSGSVEARQVTTKSFDIGATSGSVEFENGSGNGYIHTVSGSIQVRDVKGDLKFKSTSGSINAEGVEGTANTSTVSGSINIASNYLKESEFNSTSGSVNIIAARIENNGHYKGNSVSGEFNIRLPQDAGFEIDASSTSGSIRNEFTLSEDKGSSKKNLRGVVGNGDAVIKIHTVSGGINILR